MLFKKILVLANLNLIVSNLFGMLQSPRISKEEIQDAINIFVTNKLSYEAIVRGIYVDEKNAFSDLAKVKKTYKEFTVPAEKINFPAIFSRKLVKHNKNLNLVRTEGIDPKNKTIVSFYGPYELNGSVLRMTITARPLQSDTKQDFSSSSSDLSLISAPEE